MMAEATKSGRLTTSTAVAMLTSPTAVSRAASRSCRAIDVRATSACVTAADPKTAKVTAPATKREGSCRVPARNVGASEVKSPKTAKPENAPAPAEKNVPREVGGSAIRWGR